MSISDQQLEANRANALKSTGPVTPEGKAKSSQNARRHGITAHYLVMTEQDRQAFDEFRAGMIADLAPVGDIELFLAATVAEEAWRLDYSRAQSHNLLASGCYQNINDFARVQDPETREAFIVATASRDKAKILAQISLYEQRIQRSFQRHYDHLKKVQAERKAQRAIELEEARLLSQLAAQKNLPGSPAWSPSDDGFVFSTDEVSRYAARFARLQLARQAEKQAQNPSRLPKAA